MTNTAKGEAASVVIPHLVKIVQVVETLKSSDTNMPHSDLISLLF
jgi:hypothetical protein